MAARILADRAPLLRILPRGIFQLALTVAIGWLVWQAVGDTASNAKDLLWTRLAFTVPFGIIFLIMAIRNLQRPFLKAAIASNDECLLFRLPRFPFPGSPIRVIRERSIPWKMIKDIRWTVSSDSKLEIDSDENVVGIESGDFSIGLHDLDRELRTEAVGHGRSDLPVIAPLHTFTSTPRILMMIFGMLLVAGGIAMMAATPSGPGTSGPPLVLFLPIPTGIGLLILAAVPRSRVIIDSRGVLCEQGAKTRFLPWSAVQAGWGKIHSELGIWVTFKIEGGNQTGSVSYTLYQVLGVGLPVRKIADTIGIMMNPDARERAAAPKRHPSLNRPRPGGNPPAVSP